MRAKRHGYWVKKVRAFGFRYLPLSVVLVQGFERMFYLSCLLVHLHKLRVYLYTIILIV